MRFRAHYEHADKPYEAPGWIQAVSEALRMADEATGPLEAVESEEDGLDWQEPPGPRPL